MFRASKHHGWFEALAKASFSSVINPQLAIKASKLGWAGQGKQSHNPRGARGKTILLGLNGVTPNDGVLPLQLQVVLATMNTYNPPLSLAVSSSYQTSCKKPKGCEQWDTQTSTWEGTTSRLLNCTSPSDGKTTFFWHTSLLLFCQDFKPPNPLFFKTPQYFPSLDLQSFNPHVFNPVSLETFLSQQMPPQNPCPDNSVILRHSAPPTLLPSAALF